MYNGQDLRGWKGLVANPVKRRQLSADTLALLQVKADEIMRSGWEAKGEELHFTGHGDNLCSVKDYQDFEMYVDWKIEKDGDAGLYLRGSPQVQIWDHTNEKDFKHGCQKGSGGLWNNSPGKPGKDPLVLADKPAGEWNHCQITCCGPKIDVVLNGQPVTSFDMTLWRSGTENPDGSKMPPWLNKPLSSHPTKGAIGLQGKHGGAPIWFRNIKIKPLG